jgi:hypothetical protein
VAEAHTMQNTAMDTMVLVTNRSMLALRTVHRHGDTCRVPPSSIPWSRRSSEQLGLAAAFGQRHHHADARR